MLKWFTQRRRGSWYYQIIVILNLFQDNGQRRLVILKQVQDDEKGIFEKSSAASAPLRLCVNQNSLALQSWPDRPDILDPDIAVEAARYVAKLVHI